jgi:hypothetical protein
VTPATLKTYLGEHDLGGVTIPQYLARLGSSREWRANSAISPRVAS